MSKAQTTNTTLIEQAQAELLKTTSPGTWFAANRNITGHWKTAFDLLEQAKGPVPSGMLWGHTMSVNLKSSTRQREFEDMKASGGNCPRIDANTSSMNLARQVGFKQFCVIVGNFRSMPDLNALANQAITICKSYPEAIIEPGNELNFSMMTSAQVAQMQVGFYSRVKAQVSNTILLSSVGNGPSSVEDLMPIDWCKRLRTYGCTAGKGFDWANYHVYGNPLTYDKWMHCWTPDASGQSCQSVLGNPPFAVTEFGEPLQDVGGSEATQAAHIGGWMDTVKANPNCRYAAVYALSDDAPGSKSGYGLRRMDLSHRPAWDAYQQRAA